MGNSIGFKKFENCLNAIHYCMWKNEIKIDCFFEYIYYGLLSLVASFFSEKLKKKYLDWQHQRKAKYKEFRYNQKYGVNIEMANHWFGYIYSSYPGFFGFIIAAIAIKSSGGISSSAAFIVAAIPVGLGYIPAYIAVFSNNRYLQYFKMFAKEDEQWHRKWNRRTNWFIVGSVLSFLLGLASMFAILILT